MQKTTLSSIYPRVLSLVLLLLSAAFLVPTAAAAEEAAPVFISEFMPKNKAMLRDADGDFSDWIELENGSDAPISLAGWQLSDSLSKPGWTLPERILAPGERLLVFADGKDRREGELHTDFSLSEGETLCLRDPAGTLADRAFCSVSTADLSLIRTADGSFSETQYPSPGWLNTDAGYDSWQRTLVPSGPFVISEVCVFDREANYGWKDGADWLEIHNITEEDCPLNGYSLSDKESEPRRWTFPDVTLGAGEYLRVYCADFVQASLYTTGFSLSSEAEQLYLTAPDGTLADYISLRGIPYDGSYGRVDGEPGWFYFAERTPSSENGEGFRRVSRMPEALTEDGVFDGVKRVTVEFGGAGSLYYTLDGSRPTRESEHYTGPITLTETSVVRVVCIEDGALPSAPLTQSYFLNEGHSLPVLSLATDSPYAFDSMYTSSWRDVELAANLAFYEKDGSFSVPCGVKLNGATSLILPKKNLSLRFRDAYGAGTLEYDCFGGGVTSFTNLLLRSGQAFKAAILRNELCCAMAQKATDAVLVQRFQYGVLYINGKYSGIYALEEKANEQMFADHNGVSRESVTVCEPPFSENDEIYEQLLLPCLSTDMSVEANYRALSDKLDMDSLIDWVILEGWSANKDLTSGNLRFGRSSEGDGKWHLILYDLDATLSDPYMCFDLLSPASLNLRQIGTILSALLENADFRTRLLQRAAELLSGPLSNEALLAEIDLLAEQLEPEVARNHRFINTDPASWSWNIAYLRDLATEEDWQASCVEMLCRYLSVTEEERALYFGE